MLQFSWMRTTVIVLVTLTGVLLGIPNFLPAEAIPGFLPHQRMVLGLDLQGGSHLLLQVNREDIVAQLNGALPFMLNALNNPSFQEKVAKAAQTFLSDPKSITITASPAAPVPFQQIMGSAMTAPQSLPDTLALDVTANN